MRNKKEGFLRRAVGNASALYNLGRDKWRGARAEEDLRTVKRPKMLRDAYWKQNKEDLRSPNRVPDVYTFEHNEAVKAKDKVKDKIMKRARQQKSII